MTMPKKRKRKAKKQLDNVDDVPESKDIDFSFEDDEVTRAVDKLLGGSEKDKKTPKMHHITERIALGMEIKHNLPDKGYLRVKAEKGDVKFIDRYGEEQIKEKVIITSKDIKDVEHVEITDGLFSMDFRNDCNFWFNRSPVTVPAMIKQAVHTHVDIKKCYDMEKRKTEIPIWLILGLIIGGAIILIMMFSLLS